MPTIRQNLFAELKRITGNNPGIDGRSSAQAIQQRINLIRLRATSRSEIHKEADSISFRLLSKNVQNAGVRLRWPRGSKSEWAAELRRLKALDAKVQKKKKIKIVAKKPKKVSLRKPRRRDEEKEEKEFKEDPFTGRPSFKKEGTRERDVRPTSARIAEEEIARDARIAAAEKRIKEEKVLAQRAKRDARIAKLDASARRAEDRASVRIRRERMDITTGARTINFRINDFNVVRTRVGTAIRQFAQQFNGRKFIIEGAIVSENNNKTRTHPARENRVRRHFARDINRFITALEEHIEHYQRVWSIEQTEMKELDRELFGPGRPDMKKSDEVHVERIAVKFRIIANMPPPAVALSNNNVNCLIKCIFDQTHKKKVLKENVQSLSRKGHPFKPVARDGTRNYFIDCWDFLEDKYKCRITILDTENNFWRLSSKKLNRTKYQPDVIVRLHNYHVEPLSPHERKVVFGMIKSVEVEHRLLDDIWHAKKSEKKATELQDKSYTNVDKKSKHKHTNIWLSMNELEKLHLKMLRENIEHFLIEPSDDIIGIIVPGLTKKDDDGNTYRMDKHYKTHDAFRDMSSYIVPYETTDAWTLSSYVRGEFKKYLITEYKNDRTVLQQIPCEKVYSLCAAYHTPVCRVFNRRLNVNEHGKIHQIDGNRAYRNAAVGNIADHLKEKYWHGLPKAPRSVRTYDHELLTQITMDALFGVYGMILFEYDQSMLPIPTFFDGVPRKTGVQYLSINCVKYMFDLGVKIWLLQAHYNEENCDPFTKFFNKNDKTLDVMINDESEQGERDWKNYRLMPNMLIGGLNRHINKTKVFHTISKEEFDRFIIKSDEINRLITKLNVRTLTDNEKKGLVPNEEATVEEFIVHYQEGETEHHETFNMVHWSKYTIDTHKMVLHDMVVTVCENDISRLGCINTDSITYVGKSLNKLQCSYTKSFPDIDDESDSDDEDVSDRFKWWHTEASNMTEGILVSNGLRYLCDKRGYEFQRHSGYCDNQTRDKFIKLLNYIPQQEVLPDDRDEKYIADNLAEDYDSKLEFVKICNQKLVATIEPAGKGKSEIVKWQIGEESKFSGGAEISKDITVSDMYRKYLVSQVLSACPTHVSRKVVGGNTITCAGLKFSLKFYATSKLDVSKLKAIIFDEISMMDRHELEKLDKYLRLVLKNRPFGGLDIYLFGDFKQLPPWKGVVCKEEDLLFNSKLYAMFEQSELKINYRQKNEPVLQSILDKTRDSYKFGGDAKSMRKAEGVLREILSEDEIKALNDRVVTTRDQYKFIRENNIHSVVNSNVCRQDNNAGIHGKLKVGSRVIFRRTFKNQHKYNGDLNVIEDVRTLSNRVKNDSLKEYKIAGQWYHEKYFIEPEITEDDGYRFISKEKKYADIHLNYASTVHCCQGRTIDKIVIDTKKLSINLFYVALSRATKLQNVHLVSQVPLPCKKDIIDDTNKNFQPHPSVVKFLEDIENMI